MVNILFICKINNIFEMSKQSSSGDKNNPSKEDIVNHFNDMRNQQRDIAEKITEFNLEIKEHEFVNINL